MRKSTTLRTATWDKVKRDTKKKGEREKTGVGEEKIFLTMSKKWKKREILKSKFLKRLKNSEMRETAEHKDIKKRVEGIIKIKMIFTKITMRMIFTKITMRMIFTKITMRMIFTKITIRMISRKIIVRIGIEIEIGIIRTKIKTTHTKRLKKVRIKILEIIIEGIEGKGVVVVRPGTRRRCRVKSFCRVFLLI
jgi:hypothetical protein